VTELDDGIFAPAVGASMQSLLSVLAVEFGDGLAVLLEVVGAGFAAAAVARSVRVVAVFESRFALEP
jgi:hypothetical protein